MSWRSKYKGHVYNVALKGSGLGTGRNRARMDRASLSFRNRNESKVRWGASVAPQAMRGKPSFYTRFD